MFNPAPVISLIICLFSFSNGNSSIDDDMLIAFMKGQQGTIISEYTTQKYEAHLGILYFLKKNWQRKNILENFREFEREECPKYRKYLNILYEYLLKEYAGIPTVKPKFVHQKKQIEIEWPINYVLNSLAYISYFYFYLRTTYYYRDRSYSYEFEPKLLNEKKLEYEIKSENEPKMPNNEMILQLAIDTANDECPNESVEEIIKQIFDRNLYEMFKKAEERAQVSSSLETFNDNKLWIIIGSKFDDSNIWKDDALFIEFLKGQAMNFGKMRVQGEWGRFDNRYTINKKKEDVAQVYEALFGVVYLMKTYWQCDKIGSEFNEKCQKYRNYLHILYEYLFRIYVEAKNREISKQLPAVKPIFLDYSGNLSDLSNVVKRLNYISKCLWKKGDEKLWDFNLLNEVEMNYEENKDEKIEMLRSEFDQEMEKICENAKRNAAEEAKIIAKIVKEYEEYSVEFATLEHQYRTEKYIYDKKFDVLNSSPFS